MKQPVAKSDRFFYVLRYIAPKAFTVQVNRKGRPSQKNSDTKIKSKTVTTSEIMAYMVHFLVDSLASVMASFILLRR